MGLFKSFNKYNKNTAIIDKEYSNLSYKQVLTETNEIKKEIKNKSLILIVSENSREWFAENGYDSKMGARPMFRLIEKEIRKPLADELLFGKLSIGGTVKVSVKKDKIVLNIS